MGRFRLRAAGVAVALLVTSGLTVAAAGATIVPFQKVDGVNLGMTLAQAHSALGPCTMLTVRNRSRGHVVGCYISDEPTGPGAMQLVFRSLVKRCGAVVGLRAGRVDEVQGGCPDRLASGAGIGSTFKQMYGSFPKGRVRCGGDRSFQHWCAAQRRTASGISVTKFLDEEGTPNQIVAWVYVYRCSDTLPPHTFNPCSPTFLTDPGVREEFTP